MTTKTTHPLTEQTVRDLARRHDEPDWLLDRRLNAWRAFQAMSMPDPLDEEWRRTDISGLDLDAVLSAEGQPSCYVSAGSLPEGVVFGDLHVAARQHEALLRQHLHSLVRPEDWKLAALQAALWQAGAFVYVPQGVEVALPLTLVMQHAGGPSLPHLLVVAAPNSSVTVIQDTQGGAPSGTSLVSGAVEIVAMADSRVRYVDVQDLETDGVYNFSTIRAHLDRGAELSASLIGLGARLTKTRLEVLLEGEGSRADLLGLSLGAGKQHFDYVTLQDHVGPRTESDLLFKAGLTDESSEVWYGTVRIQKGAHGSAANQTSRNLLLSDRAKAAPIPVLEIEAYDILRCSHGATAGPLDEDQRFYLESRGIPPAETQRLLVEAFFREAFDRVPDAGTIRERIEQALTAKLAKGT